MPCGWFAATIKGPRDGIETAEILKKNFDVPIVYLTAYADEETIFQINGMGPFDINYINPKDDPRGMQSEAPKK